MSSPPRLRTEPDVLQEFQRRLDVLERLLLGLSQAVAASNGVNVYHYQWPSPDPPSTGISDADPVKATSSLFAWIAAATDISGQTGDTTIDLLVNGAVIGTLTIALGSTIGFVGVSADVTYGVDVVQAQLTSDGGVVGVCANALAVL